MGSLMSAISGGNPNFMNTFSQRVLSQSNNVSYSTRGTYRVIDTEPSRKADYWFRDFGMVMACAYMAEFGFRAVDSTFTVPMITDATGLNKLSELVKPGTTDVPLYPGAINYNRLPMVYKNRVMGSLIRSSSAGAVPELMKKLELEKAQKLLDADAEAKTDKNKIQGKVRDILNSDSADRAHELVQEHLDEHKLDLKTIQTASAIENKYSRESKLKELVKGKSETETQAIRDAVELDRARQMRILTEHLQIKMNFSEYLTEKYLNDQNPLHEVVDETLKTISEKGSGLYGAKSGKVKDILNEVWYLSKDKRIEEFNKKFADLEQGLYYGKGRSIATPKECQEFAALGEKCRDFLQGDDKFRMEKIVKKFGEFYKTAADVGEKGRALLIPEDHLKQIFSNLGHEMRDRIHGKVESTLKDAIKATHLKDRTEAFEDLTKMNVPGLLNEGETKTGVEKHINEIKNILGDKMGQGITQEMHTAINEHLHGLKEKLVNAKELADLQTLKPIFKSGVDIEASLKRLISEGIKSKEALSAISKIQKSSTWPKTFATVALNLVFYGFAASLFDNKVLQPYQSKLVAERGTSQEIVNAGYLGLFPGAAVLTQMFDKTSLPLFRKMGSFTRFASVGGAALATFAGSSYLILQQLLKSPPKNPPQAQGKPMFAANPQPMAANVTSSPFANAGLTAGGFNQNAFNRSNFNGFAQAAPSLPPAFVMPQAFGAPRFGAQVNEELKRKPVRQG